MPGLAAWFVLPALVFSDLASKVWARSSALKSHEVDLGEFMSLRLVENTGVSFGALDFGKGLGQIIPLGVTIGVAIGVAVWMVRLKSEWRRLFVGFILAGATGNIVDRLIHGGVTDFIDYRWFGQSLFVGNIADIWIAIGVVGAFLPLLLASRRQPRLTSQALGNHE